MESGVVIGRRVVEVYEAFGVAPDLWWCLMDVRELVLLAVELRKAAPDTVIPLSGAEISEVEAGLAGRLPFQYRLFLELAGRRLGVVGLDSDLFYPGILGLREDTLELLAENGVEGEFGSGDIPFYMYQGYDVAWMHGPGDDPPVYRFTEGGRGVYRDAERFTDWLRRSIEARVS